VASAGETRQKMTKKRSLHSVNEHFESFFNDVSASAALLRQPPRVELIVNQPALTEAEPQALMPVGSGVHEGGSGVMMVPVVNDPAPAIIPVSEMLTLQPVAIQPLNVFDQPNAAQPVTPYHDLVPMNQGGGEFLDQPKSVTMPEPSFDQTVVVSPFKGDAHTSGTAGAGGFNINPSKPVPTKGSKGKKVFHEKRSAFKATNTSKSVPTATVAPTKTATATVKATQTVASTPVQRLAAKATGSHQFKQLLAKERPVRVVLPKSQVLKDWPVFAHDET
ncbi:MAG: hypothetical protein ACR2PX_10585, partial [Endozoicomonas sp.]|uniref:hypothetical protein n=1 Tax=Endozoicomonas sp. TaxID=1892382 RepID=UPI003D9B0866